MASSGHRLSEVAKKQRKQQAQINTYKKQQKWLLWAGVALVILALLLLLATGYSYNWWKGSSKDSLRDFSPASTTLDNTGAAQETADTSAGGSTGGAGGSGGAGGGGTSGGTNTTTTIDRGSTNTVTNNNSSTKETVKETNTNTTTTQPSAGLLDLLADIDTGDNLDALLSRADDLSVSASCRTELLIVRVCDFEEGDFKITVKGLLTDNLVTSVVANF